MIDLDEVGSHVDPAGRVRFGIYLPGITAAKGYSVVVRIIHAADQFTPEIPPISFPLAFDPAHELGLWSATVDIPATADPASHFGRPGRYLYRYQVLWQEPGEAAPSVVSDLVTDPFAREAGPARLAAFTIDDPAHPTAPFSFDDDAFVVPPLDDLVVYELQVEEFDSTFDGVIARLDYLAGLGVNVARADAGDRLPAGVRLGLRPAPLPRARGPLGRRGRPEAAGEGLPRAGDRRDPRRRLPARQPEFCLRPGLSGRRRARADGPLPRRRLRPAVHLRGISLYAGICPRGQPALAGGVPRRRLPL